jgi:hypothetical protein
MPNVKFSQFPAEKRERRLAEVKGDLDSPRGREHKPFEECNSKIQIHKGR